MSLISLTQTTHESWLLGPIVNSKIKQEKKKDFLTFLDARVLQVESSHNNKF